MTCAKEIRITGIVQGVGFRPFVYTFARACSLHGWVKNDSKGVRLHIEGDAENIAQFLDEFSAHAPSISKIDTFEVTDAEVSGFTGFTISESQRFEGESTLISPDLATCDACTAELFELTDRRYRYPFINCTNCGPRFTIIEDIPYDRPLTSMRDFPMCDECAHEYRDPSDRRFHAQPDACFVCGPRLYLYEVRSAQNPYDGDARNVGDREKIIASERARSDAILDRTVQLLRDGKIIALKGLGGYHLVCDATSSLAVQELRDRKHRYGKPLAVMVPSLAMASDYCKINELEARTLSGTVRPIVLLRRHEQQGKISGVAPLAVEVANDLPEIGLMLPYTPVQHLLLAQFDGPLVMTSGNISGEPIEVDDTSARMRLSQIADAFLSNDRAILSRYDDSVVRIIAGEVTMIRRARGYAPYPLTLGENLADTIDDIPSVLGVGPEQKNTFTLTKGSRAFVSQHIGDLESAETMHSWENTLALYERLFRIEPHLIACDMHPEYLATKWARAFAKAQNLPLIEVQHHHAHIAGVLAEHSLAGPITGIAFDGTGYGVDGTIWGGEVLIADRADFTRFAHLDRFRLPGGAAAIRRPARSALALLDQHGLLDHPGAQAFLDRIDEQERNTVLAMVKQKINSPLTSSMGRLFDIVSSLTGVQDDATYEGSPAIELEARIDSSEPQAYKFVLCPGEKGEDGSSEEALIIDHAPIIRAILDDIENNISVARIAAKFHHGVARLILDLAKMGAQKTNDDHIALTGGVFMNRHLLEEALLLLKGEGLLPLTPKVLPVNDGAVSYGQAIVARARYAK